MAENEKDREAAAVEHAAHVDERDEPAVQHDLAADLAAFVAPNGEPYGQDNPGRPHAAMDRLPRRRRRGCVREGGEVPARGQASARLGVEQTPSKTPSGD